MTNADISQRFAESLRRRVDLEDLELEWSRYEPDADWSHGILIGARRLIAAQSLRSFIMDLSALHNPGPGLARGILEKETNIGLALALLITGRTFGADTQLIAGSRVVGDHLQNLQNVRIEVGVQRSDFLVEFLVTWREYGPHPKWHTSERNDYPSDLEVEHQVAIIRDQYGPDEPHMSDRKTRRLGLESLGLMVVPYEDHEAEVDPFAIADRVLKDLQRRASDDFTP